MESTPKLKRPAYAIREETMRDGAILLSFTRPVTSTLWWNQWTKMEKYGFFVLSTACMLPYQYFRKTFKAGDKLKGHQRAAHCFFNREADHTKRTNQHGWPCDEQISHLCHNPDCCNPQHLVIEARWKNARRNFCGENGLCDCGMQPTCIRTYTNPETFSAAWTIVTDTAEVNRLLAPLATQFPFQILSSSFYNVENDKARNRKKRKKAQDHHKKQAEKKAKVEQSKSE